MPTSTPTHRHTVLIVDDEPLFLSSVAEGLRTQEVDYEVLTAANGREALALAESHPVDLVVTDIKMPELDGFGLIGYLLETHPGTPVIVMTAFGTPDIEEKVRATGAIGYLEKPIDFQTLTERIEQALRRSARGHIQGITLFSFLQLLQMERKTCTLEVTSKGRTARLHFQEGELIDAEAGDLRGEEAVQALSSWEAPKIEIDNVCRAKKRTIATSLTNLLLEAARLEDEKAKGVRPRPAAASGKAPEAGKKPKSAPPQTMLEKTLDLDGVLAAALVDLETVTCLALATRDSDLDKMTIAVGSAELVRAKRDLAKKLGFSRGAGELLVTLEDRVLLLRLSPRNHRLCLFLAVDRDEANLSMLRLDLEDLEEALGL
jgi:DNA-binding response OmpR family regulator